MFGSKLIIFNCYLTAFLLLNCPPVHGFTIANVTTNPTNPNPINPLHSSSSPSSRRPLNIVDNEMTALPLDIRLHPGSGAGANDIISRPSLNRSHVHSSHSHPNMPKMALARPTQAAVAQNDASANANATLSNRSVCLLPADFWCDDPSLALTCTGGSHQYCEEYRKSVRERKLEMKLAFETGCPDSQKLIVHRLYPKVLSKPEFSNLVDFKAHPWGLARRQADQNIRCHHGPRECEGNRLLTCALNHFQWDREKKHRILFCFMHAMMMARGDPDQGMVECLGKLRANQQAIGEIRGCAQSGQANSFQLDDEHSTERILSRPRFVPFLSLNGKSHIHMQAPLQLLLAEKLRHWNHTLHRNNLPLIAGHAEQQQEQQRRRTPKSLNSAAEAAPEHCKFPPEFWCSDPSIARACFSPEHCERLARHNFGQPVHLRIIYNSQFEPSRDYLLRYIGGQLLNRDASKYAENVHKMRVELEPAHFTRRALVDCGVGRSGADQGKIGMRGCHRRIMEICIFANLLDLVDERNRLLICLNSLPSSNHDRTDLIGNNWVASCFPALTDRNRILECFNSERLWLGHNAQLVIRQNYRALRPEPRRTDPWILLNGYSLSTVQNYARVLDQMICLWYSGPGHDRERCGRCDYEPTHC